MSDPVCTLKSPHRHCVRCGRAIVALEGPSPHSAFAVTVGWKHVHEPQDEHEPELEER